MPKFKIREEFTDGSTQNFYVSANDEATALGIATTLFGGEHLVLEEVDPAVVAVTEQAPTSVGYWGATVTLKQEDTDAVTFVSMLFDNAKSSNEVMEAFKAKTINGVRADAVSLSGIYFVDVA